MSKIEYQQAILELLGEEGYRPSTDADGDILFKHEGHSLYVLLDAGDPDYLQIVLPNFWSLDTGEEKAAATRAAERATATVKVAKVYLVRDNVWASYEMLCTSPDSLRPVLSRAIRTLSAATRSFARQLLREQGDSPATGAWTRSLTGLA